MGDHETAKPSRLSLIWGLLAFVYIIVQVRWITVYRDGQLLDIDEAGYLSMAVNDYLQVSSRGLVGLLNTISHQAQAPVAPALAAGAYSLFGLRLTAGFAVPVISGLLTIIGTYFLAKASSSRVTGIIAAAMIATLPLLIMFSRAFHFALPLTAVSTFALLALVKSRGAEKPGWTILMGVLVGLMPLTRTMAVSFMPWFFVAALVAAIAMRSNVRSRLVNLALAFMATVLVAGSWLWFSWQSVFGYLLSFGYGEQAARYGRYDEILARAVALVDRFMHFGQLAHVLLIILGFASALAAAVFVVLRGQVSKDLLRESFASPASSLATVFLGGFAMLVSSRNTGSAFDLPLWPPLITLAAMGLSVWAGTPWGKWAIGLVVSIACLFGAAPSIDEQSDLAIPRMATLPVLGTIPLTDGRGTLRRYEVAYHVNTTDAPLSSADRQAWWTLNDRTLEAAAGPDRKTLPMAIAFRGTVFNSNSLTLRAFMSRGVGVPFATIDGLVGDDVETYKAWLTTGSAKTFCVLLSAPQGNGTFTPSANVDSVEEAARQTGFSISASLQWPSGTIMHVWRREPCAAQGASPLPSSK